MDARNPEAILPSDPASLSTLDPSRPALTIVMPCLNEAETLGTCIRKAQESFRRLGLQGEVVVADNGSVDGSPEIARGLGARVVAVAEKGYGHALRAGIEAARAPWILMGDSDDSYDFLEIGPFVERLREGHQLVMGNRFRGGIRPGAMPWKHRWIGNPVLTFIGRLLFSCPVGDFHCGLRAFTLEGYRQMDLRTTGMEFASEMVIKSGLKGLRISEVATVLHPDGRSRAPHLRSWRDGWRHLRFMLLLSPLWLFFIPGLALLGGGSALGLWLLQGPRTVGSIQLDIHTLLVASAMIPVGFQLIIFAVFTKSLAVAQGLHPSHPVARWVRHRWALEAGLAGGLLLLAGGGILLAAAVWSWQGHSFGPLDPRETMRRVIPSLTLIMLGVQTLFASFFLAVQQLFDRPAAPKD